MQTPIAKRLLRALWAVAAGLVIVGSLLPASSTPMRLLDALHINDKLEHFAAYAALAFLPTLHEKRRTLAIMALALVAMGVLLEFGQLLSEGRFFEVDDMIADACGVLVGLLAGAAMRTVLGTARWIDP